MTEELTPKYKHDGWLIFENDPIHGGQQVHPQNHFAFSPIPANPISLEGLALLLVVKKLGETPEGREQLERLALKYLDSCARIIESVQDACHSNWLTALNNQHITAAISHRLGLMADGDYMRVLMHYQSVFDKMFALEIVGDTITGVTTLVQGSKTFASGGTQGLASLVNVRRAGKP